MKLYPSKELILCLGKTKKFRDTKQSILYWFGGDNLNTAYVIYKKINDFQVRRLYCRHGYHVYGAPIIVQRYIRFFEVN